MPHDDLLSTLAAPRPTEAELSRAGRTKALELAREWAHNQYTDTNRTYTLSDILNAVEKTAMWAAGYES